MSNITAQQYMPLLQSVNQLPITPTSWIPIALVAALTVAIVAAMVYMLAGIMRSDEARGWARFQLYEVMLSVLLIIIFGSITYLFFLNPQKTFSAINLVPSPCTSANTIYTLAACDLGLFNNASFAFAAYTFYTTWAYTLIAGISPGINIEPLGSSSITIQLAPPGIGPDLSTAMTAAYGALLAALIFNQVQLIMISASVLFLAFFLTIGLIARTLGFLRTFGGAMIAFGLGMGIIYPLLICMTYGYVDVGANLACLQYAGPISTVTSGTTGQCGWTAAVGSLASIMFSLGTVIGSSVIAAGLPVTLGALVTYIGYIIAGVTIIPIMNIAILDAFVIDFSSAIGERMSIQQLFSSFL